MVEAPYDRMMLGVSPPPRVEKTDDKSTTDEDPEIEVVLVKRPPVTSSLRQSRRLLFAQTGIRAIAGTVTLFVVTLQISRAVEHVVRSLWIEPYTRGIAGVLVGTLVASPLMIMWTHLVISTPSPKRWSRLLPTKKTIWRATPATILYVVATRVVRDVPILLVRAMKVPGRVVSVANTDRSTALRNLHIAGGQLLGISFVTLAVAALIYIPAIVTMVRVYASLLPESEETIVPFDPTFDGKVVSEAEGGSGKLGLLDAWRSFNWSARFRLVKHYVKVFALQVAVVLLYLLVTVVQLRIIFGSEKTKKLVDRLSKMHT